MKLHFEDGLCYPLQSGQPVEAGAEGMGEASAADNPAVFDEDMFFWVTCGRCAPAAEGGGDGPPEGTCDIHEATDPHAEPLGDGDGDGDDDDGDDGDGDYSDGSGSEAGRRRRLDSRSVRRKLGTSPTGRERYYKRRASYRETIS